MLLPSAPVSQVGDRILKSGSGWRLGWDSSLDSYRWLVGTEEWALELTDAEMADFCRLFQQLAQSVQAIASELMDQEKIACEAESDLLWLEIEGYSHSYSLHLILLQGRRGEGHWQAAAVPELLRAIESIQVF